MRSSKSRSRSKSNRQRSLGNIVNRVFDSSGPEGKVRGTPQQIIDKYLMLARDAHLSNDRVAEQNFLQHAEHYTRMLAEAQREMQREQDMRQQHGGGQNGGNGGNGENGNRDRAQEGRRDRGDYRPDRDSDDNAEALPETREAEHDDGPGLVETPEAMSGGDAPMPAAEPQEAQPAREGKPRGARGPRGPRKPRARAEGESAAEPVEPDTSAAE